MREKHVVTFGGVVASPHVIQISIPYEVPIEDGYLLVWEEVSMRLSGAKLKSPQIIRLPCLNLFIFFTSFCRNLICQVLGA